MFICAYLGLRRGELCGLRWSDVGLEHQTITIEDTHTLYLPDTLCDMLKAAKENQQACRAEYKNAYDDNDYVVVMEDGGRSGRIICLSCSANSSRTTTYRKSCCMSYGIHSRRCPIRSGIPAYNIGKALGHSTPATTQKIYTHLLDRAHTQAVEGVAAIADEARRKAGKEYLLQLAKALIDEIRVWDR